MYEIKSKLLLIIWLCYFTFCVSCDSYNWMTIEYYMYNEVQSIKPRKAINYESRTNLHTQFL